MLNLQIFLYNNRTNKELRLCILKREKMHSSIKSFLPKLSSCKVRFFVSDKNTIIFNKKWIFYHFFCREQRLIDASRFRTRTISREDIVGSGGNSPQQSPSSPKTLKQRRAEDADRYRTQTISNTSLVGGLNLLPGSELGVPAPDSMGPMSPQVKYCLH